MYEIVHLRNTAGQVERVARAHVGAVRRDPKRDDCTLVIVCGCALRVRGAPEDVAEQIWPSAAPAAAPPDEPPLDASPLDGGDEL